jgi:hypothetical protein
MGYSIDLEGCDLRCKSEADTHQAAATINGDSWMSPYHLQVSPRKPPEDGSEWRLEIDHFQGDHWPDEEAKRVWLALVPHMADGATLEFQGEGPERWRIRWQDGKCYEDYVAQVIWAVQEEITAESIEAERAVLEYLASPRKENPQ